MRQRIHSVGVDKKHFQIVKEGMERVSTFGTGRYAHIPGIALCGKTGTVENNHGKDHSLYIGFAPKDDPKIAVAVVVENAGFGATWAAPIASLLIEQYLTGKIERTWMLEHILNTVLNHYEIGRASCRERV